jgi:hypothetical protein
MDTMLTSFDRAFASLDAAQRKLLSQIDDARLFEKPGETGDSTSPFSCGEHILRSAAMVEKTFGGITTRLWDDPFEWTLPEKLNDKAAVLNYLDEVEATRQKGFAFFTSDDDLRRQIPAPEKLTPIFEILLETLIRASHYQGRAFAVFQMLTGERPPRF